MELPGWKQLQDFLQSFESALQRRENVIRFLLARVLLMLTMVLVFWLAMRNAF